MSEEYGDVSAICEFLGVKNTQVHRLIKYKKFGEAEGTVQKISGKLYVKWTAVRAYQAKRKTPGRPRKDG